MDGTQSLPKKLVWFDLETTGLDPQRDQILEIAAYTADFNSPFSLKPLYEAVIYIGAPRGNDFVREMHTKNGLWKLCADSLIDVYEADGELESRLGEGEFYAAGSSIHFDVEFAKVHLPKFAAKLSHRHYDVSALKLFMQSVGGPEFAKGGENHRAAGDVMESVAHATAVRQWLYDESERHRIEAYLAGSL